MNHILSFMQVNISLVTHVDININKYLLSLVFLRLEVGLDSNFKARIGSRYKICSPGLTWSKKYGLRLNPSQKKKGLTHPYWVMLIAANQSSLKISTNQEAVILLCDDARNLRLTLVFSIPI